MAVTGQLTLKGKALPVTLTASASTALTTRCRRRKSAVATSRPLLPRSRFGVSAYPQATPENVRVLIQIEAIKQ